MSSDFGEFLPLERGVYVKPGLAWPGWVRRESDGPPRESGSGPARSRCGFDADPVRISRKFGTTSAAYKWRFCERTRGGGRFTESPDEVIASFSC